MALYRDDVVCGASDPARIGLVVRGSLDEGDDADSDSEGRAGHGSSTAVSSGGIFRPFGHSNVRT